MNDTVSQRVAKVFRNFQVSVSLARVQAQRVYVTGFVMRPGALNVSSLASAVQAVLQAGGPSPAGSFRLIEVRRGNGSYYRPAGGGAAFPAVALDSATARPSVRLVVARDR